MSLRALRTLVAIAQHGSFVRAAEVVCLTQSAVSLHVRSLEDEFNAPLFDRTHKVPRLNEAGHRVVERARELLALYDGIAAEIGDGSELAGRMRLGVVQTTLANMLPKALAELRLAHPRFRVQVYSGLSAELATRLDAGELDAAITTEPVKPHPSGLAITPLYREGFWLIALPSHVSADPYTMLKELPLIRFDRRAWAGRMIENELRRLRVRVQTDMELDSKEAIVEMVTRGLGVAIVPLSDQELNNLTGLSCIPFSTPQLQRKVVLLEREDRPGGRFTIALADAIRLQAGNTAIHEK